MKFDFDKVVDRHGTKCLKYDFAKERGRSDDMLPLWVADMDFPTAPGIQKSLSDAVAHGIYGYSEGKDDYFQAAAGWYEKHFGWKVEKEWLIKTPGVVFALAMAVKAYTKEGDAVLLQQPVYYPFSEVITDNHRRLINSPLQQIDGHYEINFEEFEQKIVEENVKLFLMCSPHNPVGRVWTSEELQRIGDICLQNGVFIIADEIHCELTYEGHNYTPFASLSEEFRLRSATCISPSKAFNLAGLQIANIVAADSNIRSRIDRAINDNEVCDVNPFGVIATIAAYEKSEEWLDALRKYLWENYTYVRYFFKRHLPQYSVLPLEGTYLVWIDCRAAGIGSDNITSCLQNKQKLMVNSGTLYGPGGEGFIRLNIACPRKLLIDGLVRLAKVLGH